MTDREYVKHLKKTGNFKRKTKDGKRDYNYSHHTQDEYKDKAKRYDDRIDASVKARQAKEQEQRDKIEKERKERSGPYGDFKMVAPKLKMVAPKLKMSTQKIVPKVSQQTLVRNDERTPEQGDKYFDINRP